MEHRKTILITGFAGFVGVNLTKKLMQEYRVIGVDNLSSMASAHQYAARLKMLGLDEEVLRKNTEFSNGEHVFLLGDITDLSFINTLFNTHTFDAVIHLAALTGVRQSFDNPIPYFNTNVNGFLMLIQKAQQYNTAPFLYASSSSVYGMHTGDSFSESDVCDNPTSLYAVTKLADELIAKTFFNTYRFSSIGLRFFTVYGPWNRPDMAAYIFTDSIYKGKPFNLYNNGQLTRDFTYIDDIVESISRLLRKAIEYPTAFNSATFVNVGGGHPICVADFVKVIANELKKDAIIIPVERQAGDVDYTHASNIKLFELIGFAPNTSINSGVTYLVDWYLNTLNNNKV
jgi:UDP-glucuronate 4-epimerase